MTPLLLTDAQRATEPETGGHPAEKETEKTEERLPTAALPQFANDWAAGGAATQNGCICTLHSSSNLSRHRADPATGAGHHQAQREPSREPDQAQNAQQHIAERRNSDSRTAGSDLPQTKTHSIVNCSDSLYRPRSTGNIETKLTCDTETIVINSATGKLIETANKKRRRDSPDRIENIIINDIKGLTTEKRGGARGISQRGGMRRETDRIENMIRSLLNNIKGFITEKVGASGGRMNEYKAKHGLGRRRESEGERIAMSRALGRRREPDRIKNI